MKDSFQTPLRTQVSPWRVRDFRIAAVARALSFLGDEVAVIALVLRVHDAGHGPSGVAALLLAAAVPTVLLAPWAGRVADGHDSRRVLVTCGLLQAVLCLGLATASPLPVLLGLVAALQAVQAVAGPAWTALVPSIVGEERTGRAIGDMQSLALLAGIGGPALAGLLVAAVGPSAPLVLDAATFAILALAAAALRTRRGGTQPSGSAPRAFDGLRLLKGDPLLGPMVLGLLAFVVVGEITTVVEVFLVRDSLGAGSAAFGTLGAAFAAGAGAGAVLSGRARDDRARAWAVVGSATVLGLTTLLSGLAPTVVVLGALWAVAGAANGALNVSVSSLVVLRTPDSARGQVIALLNGSARGASLAATALGGWLGLLVGPRPAFVAAGVGACLVSIGLAYVVRRSLPAVAAPQRRDDPVEALTVEG